jgi:ABC-type multidrug transport system fused ATPase/permease subunit
MTTEINKINAKTYSLKWLYVATGIIIVMALAIVIISKICKDSPLTTNLLMLLAIICAIILAMVQIKENSNTYQANITTLTELITNLNSKIENIKTIEESMMDIAYRERLDIVRKRIAEKKAELKIANENIKKHETPGFLTSKLGREKHLNEQNEIIVDLNAKMTLLEDEQNEINEKLKTINETIEILKIS